MVKLGTKILVIDDEKEYRNVYKRILNKNNYEVITRENGKNILRLLEDMNIQIVILDLVLPEDDGIEILKKIKNNYTNMVEVIIITGYGTIQKAVEAMKAGAFGFFVKSHNPQTLIHEIRKIEKMLSLHQENKLLHEQVKDKNFLLKSNSKKMKKIISMADKISNSKVNVLITGESGVGKEILAKYIHYNSKRNNKPFVTANCSAYSDNLLESELFGHKKGAFTGAIENKKGRFRKADRGTLFLDEVGEIPLSIQVKLLRAIENFEVKPVGSDELVSIDMRLISATNKNLKKLAAADKFRKDLYYRINTIEIEIPPLRERKEDIEMFIDFFIKKYEKEMKFKFKKFEGGVLEKLRNYDFPGNIRELKNVIERLMVFSTNKNGVIKYEYLPDEIKNNEEDKSISFFEKSFKKAKEEFELQYFNKNLKDNNFNVSKTARELKISRRHLINKIKKYNLKK